MPTWRRNILPACPVCGRAACPSLHNRGCNSKNPEWWLDLETGNTQCSGCGQQGSVESMRHFCDCGAVYEGGEVWEGMAAEIVNIGDLHWFRAAGIRRGDLNTRFLGWSECAACGAKTQGSEYYVAIFALVPSWLLPWEIKKPAGLCGKCADKARKRLTARWSPWISARDCRWCEAHGAARVVRIGRVRICRVCLYYTLGGLSREE
jgi:hypothetical protein